MPRISKEEFDKLAHLARLEFTPDDRNRLLNDLEQMVDFCETLNEVPTPDIDPLIYISQEVNVVRNDEVNDMLPKDKALFNAPSADSDFFRIPKVKK
jgi:aspartyl-tRNA(Asn)/glutamyl-tRNA(Gln) amidotransferase subunit C